MGKLLAKLRTLSFLAVVRTAFFAIGFLTCLLGAVGALSAMRGKEGLRRVYEDKMQPAALLNEIQGPVRDIFFRMTAVMAKQLPAAGSKVKLEEAEAKVKELWREIQARDSNRTEEEAKLISEIEAGLKAFEAFTAALKAAYDSNDHARLEQLFENDIATVQADFLSPITKLAVLKSQAVRTEYSLTSAVAQAAVTAMGALLLIVFFVFGVCYWITDGMAGALFSHTVSVSEAAGALELSSGTLSKDARSLREASAEQASTLEETTVSINQLANTVSKNAGAVKEALRLVQQCDAKAAESGLAVERMLRALEAIHTGNERTQAGVAESSKRVSEIFKLIEEIGRKTKVIHDIAFQTKMLSFNASIEAARAGEHGRGFSVVADEVGSLARRSGDASKEIHSMLTTSAERVNAIISDFTRQVDLQARDGSKEIIVGKRVAEECSKSMAEVTRGVRAMVEMATGISQSSQEQAAGIEQMNRALQEINRITQTNAAVAQSAAGQSEVLLSRSEQLGLMVDQMQLLISARQGQRTRKAGEIDSSPPKAETKQAS